MSSRSLQPLNAHAEAPYFGDAMGKLQNWLAKPIDFLQRSQIVPG